MSINTPLWLSQRVKIMFYCLGEAGLGENTRPKENSKKNVLNK